jgi:hypothetical protein
MAQEAAFTAREYPAVIRSSATVRAAPRFRVFLLVLALVLAACGFQKAKADAELAVAKHFEAVASHSTQVVLAGYDERFFSVVPRDEWAKRLGVVEGKLGQYKSFTVVNWNVNTKMGTGTTVSLTCKVTYSKYVATEAMVLFRVSDEDEFKIVKHGINSDAFLIE